MRRPRVRTADPFFGTAKLPWLLRNRPSVAARASHVVSANGYVAGMLTGRAALDDSSASLMQGFDEAAGAFDERLLGRGLGIELLPQIVATTDVVGAVNTSQRASSRSPVAT
ncbi:hypothetical protein GCM10009854_41110 [Saccharopolyspora halophila]|uniref:Carbohydrate kinase FGGY N-terminal domain-containing protein n=1 Tax=Saccharopolyspora halophila TaxID=405551 RepID=A0ABN3GQP7_9PSEU